jgi:type III secretion system low calcium response chaperone LcrH/SycD
MGKKKQINTVEKQPEITEQHIKDMIDEKLKRFSDKLSEEEMEMEREALKKVIIDGQVPREAMGISKDFMSLLYTFAFNSYNAGQYKEANQIFQMLNVLDPGVPRYLLGLAATYHKMKEYTTAIETYFTLSMIEMDSPIALFHIADCYEKLDMPVGVLMALGGAITRCGDEQKYAQLKGRCYAMRGKCKKDLGIEEEPALAEGETSQEGEGSIFSQLQEEAKQELDSL